jgi:hypothetical protein
MVIEPTFPPEIEREIFEAMAFMHPGEIPTLLRVARRVLIWSALSQDLLLYLAI